MKNKNLSAAFVLLALLASPAFAPSAPNPSPFMPPKIKLRPVGEKATITSVKPLLLRDVTDRSVSANAASRRRMIATQPASGSANHARHQVARNAQA